MSTGNSQFWAMSTASAKRKYRFYLEVGLAGGTSLEQWVITKVSRPSFTISDTEHSYLNHTFKFPGRVSWEDVSFSLVEPVSPDSTDAILSMLYQSGYRFPVTPVDSESRRTISKETAIISKFNIVSISDDGFELGKWSLNNAWISQASMGEYDYSADDLMGMDITVKYDWARYTSTVVGANNNLAQ